MRASGPADTRASVIRQQVTMRTSALWRRGENRRSPNPNTPPPFNPFTTTPIECQQGAAAATCQGMGANFQRGPNFGKPATETDYQTPRTYRFSVGLRF